VLSEFCEGGAEIILRDGEGVCSHGLDELLPLAFNKKLL
jgi:cytidine deaminase